MPALPKSRRRAPSSDLPATEEFSPLTFKLRKKCSERDSDVLDTLPSNRAESQSRAAVRPPHQKGQIKRVQEDFQDPYSPAEKLELSVQLTPQRGGLLTSASPECAQLSSHASMQALLRSMINDVFHDYQRSSKADMTGLHLDLIKLARTLRKEIRENACAIAASELERLREENKLLKEENERFRRGFK